MQDGDTATDFSESHQKLRRAVLCIFWRLLLANFTTEEEMRVKLYTRQCHYTVPHISGVN